MTTTAPDTTTAPLSLDFDPEDLTLDEVTELEEHLGAGIDSMLSGDAPKGRALKAIVWIMLRRTNPEATLEDAGKVRLRELGIELADAAGDEAAQEVDAAGE
jgi:hypothetical protein